ncbi:MAG: FAD-binding oxidoreductase [Deltaproteobacteria bacterium]|nr:FAD-binding oxidoreductase [Deltaproteobacteria bacterium]
MKTVVVGNGILGLTCALRLAQRGRAVTVVGDPARPGSATFAAAAMLSAFGEIETGALATPAGKSKLELGSLATEHWNAFAEELGVPVSRGTYLLDAGDLGEVARFDAVVAALQEYDEPHAVVRPATVPGYAPLLPARRAVRIDREGWIDPRAVVAALERLLATAGVEQIAGTARRVLGAHGVELVDGLVIEGTHTLIANGASLTALLAASALPLHVQPVLFGVGTTLELATTGQHTACLRSRGVYSVPHADRVVVGSTNRIGPEPVDDPGAAARIIDGVVDLIDHNLGDAKVLRTNVGWRPTTADGYPLIGATSIPNLAIASGTRRDGFHLAPVIADHLAGVLNGERGDTRFAAFAPERPVIP